MNTRQTILDAIAINCRHIAELKALNESLRAILPADEYVEAEETVFLDTTALGERLNQDPGTVRKTAGRKNWRRHPDNRRLISLKDARDHFERVTRQKRDTEA